MPIDINLLGDDGKRLFREWKTKVEKHNKYTVRGKYFKERRMDEWHAELAKINNHYRKILKEIENEKKKEMKELEKAVKEAEKAAKESSLKKASAKKTGRTRCPSGTRRNKKTGNCEKKSAQTRKRCPNGTRRNKKTGNCE
jgi:hypothetical protein